MGGDELRVLGGEDGLLPGQTSQGIFGVAEAQVARLVEGRKRFGDAAYGDLVRSYVEVGNCVPNELNKC